MNNHINLKTISFHEKPSEDEMNIIRKGLVDYNRGFPSGGLDIPTPDISLVLKDSKGRIVGGVITSMLIGVMHLEILWVEEKLRGKGYGKALVLEAERIGRKKGYSAVQTWTFSFQAPEFYRKIGYKLLGIFDGYPNDITEYILLKKFSGAVRMSSKNKRSESDGFTISEDTSEESMKILHKGLGKFVNNHLGELRKIYSGVKINFILKNEEEQVVGGLLGSTILKVLYIEQLWIDRKYRRKGFGRKLVQISEKTAVENGCISGLTWAYSFQSPEFFQKLGYQIFGISDGYPDSIKEYFLKKKL